MLCPGPRELALERVLDDIRSGLFGLESITLKRVVQRGRSRCRLVISVARGETRGSLLDSRPDWGRYLVGTQSNSRG